MSEDHYERPPADESHAAFCRRWERINRARAQSAAHENTRAEYLAQAKRYANLATIAERRIKQ